MTRPTEEDDLVPAGFEPVHVELSWYDGPRRGLADVEGVVHYFQTVRDHDHPSEPDDEYFVWPASEAAVAMEREQWTIFARWNARYEAGTATVDTHPGHPGTDERYDELEALLAPHRAMPNDLRRLAADWYWAERDERYPISGPLYWVRWHSPSP